jgi:hypothetical protein
MRNAEGRSEPTFDVGTTRYSVFVECLYIGTDRYIGADIELANYSPLGCTYNPRIF